MRKFRVPAAKFEELQGGVFSRSRRNRLGPFLFASIFLAHKDMYYKKQSCCPGNAYKNLCPISVLSNNNF